MQDKTGWIVRQKRLMRYAEKHNLEMDSDEVQSQDLMWDKIGGHCVANVLRSSTWSNYIDSDLINDRRDNPCRNTRAVLRGAAVTASKSYAQPTIDWSSYQLGHMNKDKVRLPDPLMTVLPEPDDTPSIRPLPIMGPSLP
jgi:hypothetical protein